MALYTLKTRDEALKPLTNYNGNSQFVRNQLASFGYGPSANQTELYNEIGRTSGANGASGSNDNFFVKRGNSIENAIGTTLAAPIAFMNDRIENDKTTSMLRDNKTRMNDVAKKYGYNTYHDVWDARDKAEAEGDAATLDFIDKTINPELSAVANENAAKATEKADRYNDYRKNDYISNKINQNNTKFLGSAINTLSTAADLTGLSSTPLSNAIQGGIEGFADEMEQNGANIDLTRPFTQGIKVTGGENFDWGRAGQNALVGAATGAVTGALNKGISNSLAKNGGNLFKGGNALTRGLNNLGSKTALGRVGSTLATGAARGAVSGAVGGATGAGLQSALNGVEFGQGVQNALQGAVQGAQQGAVTGGIMAGANMAISKTPGVGKFYNELQNAKKNWDESGSNFKERWENTKISGDSPVANRFLGGDQRNNVYEAALNELRSDAYTNEDLMALMQSVDNDEAKTLISKALEERGASMTEAPVSEANQALSSEMPDEMTEPSLSERIKNNLRSPDSKTGNVLKKMPGKIGDKYNDWVAEPAEVDEFGPRYSQFSGDAEAAKDYLMRRQQGEVPRAAYNQSLQDKNGDGFIDYVYGRPGEGEDYTGGYGLSHIQAKHGDETLSRVPYDTENGNITQIRGDRIVLGNDANNDTTVVRTNWVDNDTNDQIKKQWLATDYEQDNLASKGATSRNPSIAKTSVGSDAGDAPANRIITQDGANVNAEDPRTRVYNALTEEQNTPITTSKTSKEGKLRYAQGKELLAQYGTVDQPTARSARAVQSIQEIADAGFTKPEDVERMANVITGSNGEVSKLTKNMIKNASPVNTFAGEGDETISEYVENRVRLNSLSGTNKGKAVIETIKANLDSLPSRMPNSDVYEDNPEDVFRVVQNLEASAAELEGRGGNTYHRPTIENIHQASVLKDTASLLKNRLFDTVDVSEALTPEVAQNLKSYAPNNEKFANWVDTEVMGAKNVQDLRKAQAPWVRMSKYIDNAYTQAATVGGRMASSVGDLSKVLTGKKNLISSVADTAWNSNMAHRARAAIYDKLADRAAAKESTQTNTPVQTEIPTPDTTATNTPADTTFNPATQVYNMLGRTQGEISGEQTREKLQDTSTSYVEPLNATSSYNTNTLESLANTGNTAIYNSLANTQGTTTPQFTSVEEERQVYFFPPTGDQWTDMLSRALRRAKNAEDYDAFGSLYEMYQNGIASAQKQATNNSEVKLTDKQRQANAAARALDDFEQAESNFGYDVSDIPVIGAIANLGGNDYRSKAEALALQIGYMLSGATVNKDEAQKIGMAYVPQPRDSEAIRKSKLAQLKGIISDYQRTYAE